MSVKRSRHQGSVPPIGLGLAVLFTASVAGCSDHRMSLDEFLALQQQMQEAASTPLAAEDQEAIRGEFDRHMGPNRVGPSDVLSVTITGSGPEGLFPPTPVRVDRDGEIDLPIVGAVQVGELELEDVEDAIHAAYVPQVVKDAAIHVELVTAHTTDVLVVGAVASAGLVQLRRTERDLLHAIVAAGGVSDFASGEATLSRVRNPAEEITLNLTEAKGLYTALALEPLEDGDIVTVQAATPNTIFMGGLLNAPSPQQYGPGVEITILQAIAAAGGLRTDVTPTEATLTRRMPDGTDAFVKLDVRRIATGKDPNIMLAAGDVLWVPFTWHTRVEDFINRNIFLRAGISVNYSVSGIEYLNRQDQQSSGVSQGGSGFSAQDAFDPLGFLG
ncbi:MAG: hypothetical protein GY778_22535, partial [bacterium]|nr:hypothetical protein [bacterium]